MKYNIAVFPGDGVGPELINEGIKVIDKAAELEKFEIAFIKYPHGTDHYLETKEILSDKALKEIKSSCNAIYCGTFDNTKIDVNIIDRNIPSIIRSYFDDYVSLRPVKLLPSVECPLIGKTYRDINFVVIRENSEDFYIGAHGRTKNGKNKQQIGISKASCKIKINLDIESKGNEIAYQIGILSKKGCDRVIRFAFEFAKKNNKNKITFVDKANMLQYYNFWRENIDKIAEEYEGIDYEFNFVDTVAMQLIRQPEKYQVIASPNMFGDILGDLGTVLQGGLSFAAQGNINHGGISMFEPIHGSASQLKGKGIVNPIATIWAGALMLESLNQQNAAGLIIKSFESVLKEGRTRTHDLDGNNSTSEMGDAIIDKLIEIHE